jgi:hypothetical protein
MASREVGTAHPSILVGASKAATTNSAEATYGRTVAAPREGLECPKQKQQQLIQ